MEKNVTYNLKLKLKAGEKVFGTLMGPENDAERTVMALKEFGFDFFIVDLEPFLVDRKTVYPYIRAAKEAGISMWIRPESKLSVLGCFVDSGVSGLMIPRVNTVEEARYIVNQVYFPPIGHRGNSIGDNPYLIDLQSPDEIPFLALTEYVNNNTIVLPQTESVESISNLRHILSLEGIIGTLVGTWDLSLDIGNSSPKAMLSEIIASDVVVDTLRQVVKICKDAGKVAGIGGYQPKGYAKWAKEGYQLFLLGDVVDGNVNNLQPLIEEARSLID